MSEVVDLRGLSREDLFGVAERISRMEDLRARLGTDILLFGDAERGISSFTLAESIGHLHPDALLALDGAAICLLRLLVLHGAAFGARPIEGLTDAGLLERLGEVLRVVTEKGIVGLRLDRADEVPGGARDMTGGSGRVPADGGLHEPGDEDAPEVHGPGEIVAVDDDGRDASGSSFASVHPDPLVPRRSTPPP